MARRTFEQQVAIVGDGGWGTTLAIHFGAKQTPVTLWGVSPDYLRELETRRENRKFLPGVTIPPVVRFTPALDEAVADAGLIIIAVPSQYVREVVRRLRDVNRGSAILVSVAKGLERRTHLRISQVIREELGPVRLAVLSGPTIAREVALGQPTSAVAAAEDDATARAVQDAFWSDRFRTYTASDVPGVELGGTLKNPIAIAAGIGDGLGFGTNAKAALVSRGIVEMVRLGTALGARAETFWGLSGLGDLVTTAFSLASRNRSLGEALGRGLSLAEALGQSEMVVEGVETSRAVMELAEQTGVEMPITRAVTAVLFEGLPPREALQRLMDRSPKAESAAPQQRP